MDMEAHEKFMSNNKLQLAIEYDCNIIYNVMDVITTYTRIWA